MATRLPTCYICPYNISVTELLTEPHIATDLISVVSAMRRALRRTAGDKNAVSDLKDAQRELVRLVWRNPDVKVGEAAKDLGLAGNTVSTLVSSLVTAGWLLREPDSQDSRAARIRLTPLARERVAQWRDQRESVMQSAVDELSESDMAAVEAAIPALNRVISIIESKS